MQTNQQAFGCGRKGKVVSWDRLEEVCGLGKFREEVDMWAKLEGLKVAWSPTILVIACRMLAASSPKLRKAFQFLDFIRRILQQNTLLGTKYSPFK